MILRHLVQYYEKNIEIVNNHVQIFMDKHNMDTHEYYPTNAVFYIVPTKKDIELFDKILGKKMNRDISAGTALKIGHIKF
jgi:hypothetical protein